jgi:predicted ribosome quality control (RQC) complex YloA/Tae2 family protein
MGRLSNIVLVAEDGAILDSIKRIPPSINRYRTTLPHHPYVPPPSQEKRDPMRATINTLSLELSRAAEDDERAAAWKGLVSGFSAVSPTLAREIMFQALENKSVAAVEVARQPALLDKVLDALRSMFSLEPGGREMVVAWRERGEGERQPIEFAPYPLTHLAQEHTIERYGSISEAIAAYFGALENWSGHSALKSKVRGELEELRNREDRKLRALREEWERAQALETLRHKGEMLLSYMHLVEPGQRQLTIPEEELVIDLDPSMSPADNAQAIFKEYRKARSAHEGLPERIAEAEMRVGFADDLLTSLDLASTYDDIRAVQAELQLARNPTGQGAQGDSKNKQKAAKGRLARPRRRFRNPTAEDEVRGARPGGAHRQPERYGDLPPGIARRPVVPRAQRAGRTRHPAHRARRHYQRHRGSRQHSSRVQQSQDRSASGRDLHGKAICAESAQRATRVCDL